MLYENISTSDYQLIKGSWSNVVLSAFQRHRLDFQEVPIPMIPTILKACEDSANMVTEHMPSEYRKKDKVIDLHYKLEGLFNRDHISFPRSQTTQMYLEELIRTKDKHPYTNEPMGGQSPNALYCIAPSVRQENVSKAILDRHLAEFLLLDFEAVGGKTIEQAYKTLQSLLRTIVLYFGFDTDIREIKASELNPNGPVTSADEARLAQNGDYRPVFLTHFRSMDEPYWNMQRIGDTDEFYKIDVLLPVRMSDGSITMMEVIGSAVRSNNKQDMTGRFLNLQGGEYAGKLFKEFGEARVLHELEEYFKVLESNPMITIGGGIGINRMVRAIYTVRNLDAPMQKT